MDPLSSNTEQQFGGGKRGDDGVEQRPRLRSRTVSFLTASQSFDLAQVEEARREEEERPKTLIRKLSALSLPNLHSSRANSSEHHLTTPCIPKADWEMHVYRRLTRYILSQFQEENEEAPPQLLATFIEEEGMLTTTIQARLKEYQKKQKDLSDNLLALSEERNPLTFTKSYRHLTKADKTKIDSIVGGEEIVMSLKVLDKKGFKKDLVSHITFLTELQEWAKRQEGRTVVLQKGFDKDRPIASVDPKQILTTFRGFIDLTSNEFSHILLGDEYFLSPKVLRKQIQPDRLLSFTVSLIRFLQRKQGITSSITSKKQGAKLQEGESDWENTPTLLLLKCMSFNAFSYADQLIRTELFPTFCHPRLDEVRLKYFSTDVAHYHIDFPSKQKFTMKQSRLFRFIWGDQTEIDHRLGSIEVTLFLKGKLSDPSSLEGEVTVSNLQFETRAHPEKLKELFQLAHNPM